MHQTITQPKLFKRRQPSTQDHCPPVRIGNSQGISCDGTVQKPPSDIMAEVRILKMTEFEFRKSVYNRFDSSKPLEPGDVFYEPVYENSEYDPAGRIFESIRYGTESLNFLSGFRGCGKTTELKRLRKMLEDEGYVVLYADALDFLLPSEPLEISDFLVTLVMAFSEQVDEALHTKTLAESYFRRFVNFLTRTKVELSGVDVGTSLTEIAKLNIKLSLKQDPTFREQLREKLRHVIGQVKQEIDDIVSVCLKALAENHEDHSGVVFILDNFEQFRDQVGEKATVVTSISALLDNYRNDFQLNGVHCVYTVPPWVKFTIPGAGLANIRLLYNVKVLKNDQQNPRKRDLLGHEKMQKVIFRRLPSADFRRLFGDVDYSILDPLIDNSGGHLSDLINMVQQLIPISRILPVTTDNIQRVISEYRARFRALPVNDAQWLHEIGEHRDNMLRDKSPESVRQMSSFLDQHYVMIYFNGEEWYDIHPIIRNEVAMIVAREARLQAQKKSG
ncbi:MAG: ATP-binding protein [Fimbriiglobus sp.]